MHGDAVIICVARLLEVWWTHIPSVAVIKGRFAQNIDILHINDIIMAYSRLSSNKVVSHIFEDKDSFDDSDSKSGEDIYGYLGAFALPCHAMNLKKSRVFYWRHG